MTVAVQVRRLLGSSRARSAVLTNGLSSIGNLVLAVFVARDGSSVALGQFAVAFAAYVLVVGLSQAVVAESLLATISGFQQQSDGARRVALIGLIAACLLVSTAIWVGSSFLLVIALTLPGLSCYEYAKSLSLGIGRPRLAILQECVWTGAVGVFAILALLGRCSGFEVFVTWSVAGCLIGLVSVRIQGFRSLPGWPTMGGRPRTTIGFGIDYLAGAGSAQLTTAALASVAGTVVVGALRAAGTALGPVTLLLGTARGLLIPYLARSRMEDPKTRIMVAAGATAMLLVPVLPLALGLLFLPDSIGRAMVGENWQLAQPIMPAIAAETIFAAASAVFFAGHRIEMASNRTLLIRLVMAPVRLITVASCGLMAGPSGAAIAMAVTAGIGAVVWSWSYVRLVRRGTRK